ncbi:hypothetical protein Q8A73_009634 [Channa argus]|nr:hypothetical protein Q8A73_009634 [Channa argus]
MDDKPWSFLSVLLISDENLWGWSTLLTLNTIRRYRTVPQFAAEWVSEVGGLRPRLHERHALPVSARHAWPPELQHEAQISRVERRCQPAAAPRRTCASRPGVCALQALRRLKQRTCTMGKKRVQTHDAVTADMRSSSWKMRLSEGESGDLLCGSGRFPGGKTAARSGETAQVCPAGAPRCNNRGLVRISASLVPPISQISLISLLPL